MIGLLVQDVLGYSALRAGICFIPFAVAFALGSALAARLAPHIAPRWLIIGGGLLVLRRHAVRLDADPRHPLLSRPFRARSSSAASASA